MPTQSRGHGPGMTTPTLVHGVGYLVRRIVACSGTGIVHGATTPRTPAVSAPPLVLINAVGLTLAVAAARPAAARARQGRLVRAAPRSVAGRHLHRPGDAPHRHAAERARRRRQRLAVPRHERGPLLAAVQPADPGRAALRDGAHAGREARASRSRARSCSGGSTRGRRSISASRRSRTTGWTATRSFGITGTPPELAEQAGEGARPVPVPHLLGADGRAAVHAVDRRCAARTCCSTNAARPDARLPAAPRLRPAAVRARRLRHGRSTCSELDDACAPLLDAAKAVGAQVWVVSEYGHCDVIAAGAARTGCCARPGLLDVRRGPFGEQLDLYASRAFAVCDHQLAHVYVADPADVPRVRDVLAGAARRGPRARRRGAARASGCDHDRGPASWSCSRSRTPGSRTRSGSTTRSPRTTPGPSPSTASPGSTRASCSSTSGYRSRSHAWPAGSWRRSSASA